MSPCDLKDLLNQILNNELKKTVNNKKQRYGGVIPSGDDAPPYLYLFLK